MTKRVSDYNEPDDAYHWWLHVLTWPIEELKVYNLYYSGEAMFRKNRLTQQRAIKWMTWNEVSTLFDHKS